MTGDEARAERTQEIAIRRRRTGRDTMGHSLHRIGVAVLFIAAVWASGRFGVHVAKRKIIGPATAENAPPVGTVTLGSAGDPVYLGESPEALRQFFLEYETPGERASADVTDQGIRRLNSAVKMTALTESADAVKVRIVSGPISGTVYWVHHSQVPSSLDPIISPIPES